MMTKMNRIPRPERRGKARRLVTVEPKGLASVRATTGAILSVVGELGDMLLETG